MEVRADAPFRYPGPDILIDREQIGRSTRYPWSHGACGCAPPHLPYARTRHRWSIGSRLGAQLGIPRPSGREGVPPPLLYAFPTRAPDVDGRSGADRVLHPVSLVPRGIARVRAEKEHSLAKADGALKSLWRYAWKKGVCMDL